MQGAIQVLCFTFTFTFYLITYLFVHVSSLWSCLQSPLHPRDFELSLFEFRRLLKMHLFGWRSRRLVTYF